MILQGVTKKVYEHVRMKPGDSCDIIADYLFCDRETVERAVGTLVEKRLVKTDGVRKNVYPYDCSMNHRKDS